MMDFLRNLAPRRETDGTRAVPVMTSRFASGGAAREGEDVAQVFDEVSAAMRPATSASDAMSDGRLPAERHVGRNDAAQASPVVARAWMHPRHGDDIVDAAPSFDATQPSHDRTHRFDAEPARDPAIASPVTRPDIPPYTHAQPGAPMSDAALAQRFTPTREADEVVHVTIGRIDVVANTAAPATAPRREPARRQETVSLSDYLRGGNDGARR